MFDFSRLAVPVIQAPMAGGPSTAALAAAVSNAGGMGFLAAGYVSAQTLRDEIARTRLLTAAPFGVNVFVPRASIAVPAQLEAYRLELGADAARLGVDVGATHDDDDDWAAKVDVLVDTAPAVASFTFGLPSPIVVDRLHDAGVLLMVTVTTAREAVLAVERGADVLCVQGPEAGGHRGTFDPGAEPGALPLHELLASVRAAVSRPVVAAGGIAERQDVARALSRGAIATQLGTAFLRSPEAGTRPTHRDALVSPEFTSTAVTRAFSGRYARSLVNGFMRAHDATAPFGYPEVHQLTSPLRAAAARAGDPDGLNLWAGTGHAGALALPAAEIVGRLAL